MRTVEELLTAAIPVRGVIVSPTLGSSDRGTVLLGRVQAAGVELAEISEQEFADIAATESPQGVLAIAEVPHRTPGDLPIAALRRVLVLDGVQDPGNVGTIIRTAAALGVDAVLAMPGTVDLWNAKVVRSAMGASFRLPVMAGSWSDIDALRDTGGLTVWGADAHGAPLEDQARGDRIALVVGNEGAGLSAQARARLDVVVALHMSSGVDSFNVAVATGIILYQLRP